MKEITKQAISARINTQEYLELKRKNINISELINELITNYIASENKETPEIEDIRKELEKTTQKRIQIEKKIHDLSLSLAIAEEKNRKEETERLEKARLQARTAREARIHDDY